MVLLALTGDQWLTLVGVTSGAIVGLAGLAFAYFNGGLERTHAEKMARGARLHEQRFSTYAQLAANLERQRLYLVRTEPLLGPQPDPPPALDDDDWAKLSGLASISPSPEVQAKLDELQREAQLFDLAVIEYRALRDRAPGPQVVAALARMRAARDVALARITDTEQTMRDELAAL